MKRMVSATHIDEANAVKTIKEHSRPLNTPQDLEPLIKLIGDARVVMLGEASHGTHEYYSWRAMITKRLIEEKGFNFIAVEGDWPDCYKLNRYIKGYPASGNSAFDVLHAFNRWPTWMWANWEIVSLAEWLKQYNSKLLPGRRIGFYGLDVYSLWESLEAIREYLKTVDPKALEIAEEAFNCLEPYSEAGSSYGRAAMFVPDSCEVEVVNMLVAIQQRMQRYNSDYENVFSTEQNALVAVNAERYYRAMIQSGPHSWNIRDEHMMGTLQRLMDFHGSRSKAIVWAHNTHIGDARATDMVDDGMLNIGELARIKFHDDGVVLVGFGSYEGTVVAGRKWDDEMRIMHAPSAPDGSWEHLLHQAGAENKLLIMDDFMNDIFIENHIGHRAIGVVYNPALEQYGNYVPSILPMRYDAFIYVNETKALHPLHIKPDGRQMPETYPFGM